MQALDHIKTHEWMRGRPEALCYGHDPVLLFTRQQILIHIGCSTVTATGAADFFARLRDVPPTLIILCHTLTPDEVYSALQSIASTCPHATSMLMVHSRIKCDASLPSVIFDIHNGPAAFSRAVTRLAYPHYPAVQLSGAYS